MANEFGMFSQFFDAPWCSIITSLPAWAVFLGHTVAANGSYTFLTQLPSFLYGRSDFVCDISYSTRCDVHLQM